MAPELSRAATRAAADALVAGWQDGDPTRWEGLFAQDVLLDFSIFREGITPGELAEKIASAKGSRDYSRFEVFNYVCRIAGEHAVQSFSMLGTYAKQVGEKVLNFRFEGVFSNKLQLDDGVWRFAEVKFQLTDENSIFWPRLYSDGIPLEPGVGDASLAPEWDVLYEDRIGVFADKRLPSIVAEYDAPWYAVPQDEVVLSDEEQLAEVYYRYAYGIDFDCFPLYDEVFTPDATIIYGDDRPYDPRGAMDMLKFERQGSCRCVHTGYIDDVRIDGDYATASFYLRATYLPPSYEVTMESIQREVIWARYKLAYKRMDGGWRISQLNFYPGFIVR